MDSKPERIWELAFVSSESDPSDGPEDSPVPRVDIRALELVDIASVRTDNEKLSRFQSTLNIVRSVHLNTEELLTTIADCAAHYAETKAMPREVFEVVKLNFSRQFMNLLGAFRSFLDHSATGISRDFGKQSREMESWKQRTSEEFDGVLAYRLFYKLRNYVQHVDVPPVGFGFQASADKDEVRIRIDVMRDELLKHRDVIGARLAEDLIAGEKHLPLVDLLDDWGGSFSRLCGEVLTTRKGAALQAAQNVLGYRKRHGLLDAKGRMCAISGVAGDQEKLNLKVVDLNEVCAHKVVTWGQAEDVPESRETSTTS